MEIVRLQEDGGTEAMRAISELLDSTGYFLYDGELKKVGENLPNYLDSHPPHPEQLGIGG